MSRPAVAGLQAAGSNLFRGRASGRVAAAAAAVEDFFLANLVAWDKRSCIKGTVLYCNRPDENLELFRFAFKWITFEIKNKR